MMDHALRSISYIADIDSVLVIMAKRNMMTSSSTEESSTSAASTQQKLICHIFETDEVCLHVILLVDLVFRSEILLVDLVFRSETLFWVWEPTLFIDNGDIVLRVALSHIPVSAVMYL